MKRCAQCGGKFGLVVHRLPMLRFCSRQCKAEYERQLKEVTRRRIAHLMFIAREPRKIG